MTNFDFNTHPFTSRLNNVKRSGSYHWMCSCPCSANHKHGDKNQSLAVAFDPVTDNVLVYCHGGCDLPSIVAAVGCSLADLTAHGNTNSLMKSISWYANKNGLRLGEIYQYGGGLFKIRFYDQDGEKTFRWIHLDESNRFGYTWNRQGYNHRLYVAGNLKEDKTIIVTEGEKDANTVHRITGLTAVSSEDGALKPSRNETAKELAEKKWFPEYNDQLTGKDVFILYDNDEAGIYFANIEAANLLGKAETVMMMDIRSVWSECPEKGDITDLAVALGDDETKKRIDQLFINATPAAPVELINGIEVHQAVEQPKPAAAPAAQQDDDIPPLETFDAEYFNNTEIPDPVPIIDKILYPGLGMLGSPAKMGKSYMMLQLAVSVATGESFLGFDVKRPGSVLYLDLQGTKARTKKRLASMGYETMPAGITLAYRARNTDNGFIQQIEQWITAADNPSLVIIDMMEQIKGSQRRTEDSYRSDNRILEPLHDIALRHDISVFGVMHTRKGNSRIKPDDPFNEIIGSVAQFGTADCAWMILGKRDEDKKQLSVICRDNDDGQEDFEAIFKNHRWTVSGTVEDIQEQKAADEYDKHPVVFTIRTLIKESGGGWYGTMSDLVNEVLAKTGEYPATTPKKMSIIVSNLAYRLSCEGIEIEYPDRNGGVNGRRYKFYRKAPDQLKADI